MLNFLYRRCQYSSANGKFASPADRANLPPMTDSSGTQLLRLKIAFYLGIFLAAMAAAVGLYNPAGDGPVYLRPFTAAGLFIVGVSVAAAFFVRGSVILRLAGLIVTLLSGLTILGIAGDTGIAGLLLQKVASPAEILMTPRSALSLLFLGIALLLARSSGAMGLASAAIALGVLIANYAALLLNLFHSVRLDGMSVSGLNPVATVLLLNAAAAVLLLNDNCKITELLFSPLLGGEIARRLLPAVIVIPSAIGWLEVLGHEYGYYHSATGQAVATFIVVTLMFAIIFFYTRKLHLVYAQQQQLAETIAASEARYRELFDYSQGFICTHNSAGIITAVNKTAQIMLGYQEEAMIGRPLALLIPPEFHSEYEYYLRKVNNEGLAEGIVKMHTKTGRTLVLRYRNILVGELTAADSYVICHGQDVTELFEAKEKLRNLSLTDELTGLYNRRGFLTLAEQQLRLERHSGTARGLALIFADMDGLKRINDTFGHEAGSEALKTLSTLLKSVIRDADIAARWGGDEFVILSIGSDDQCTEMMIERIRERLNEYNLYSGKPYRVECSLGFARVNLSDNRSFEDIIAEADARMYEEKRQRKLGRGPQLPDTLDSVESLDSFAWY